MKRIAQLDGLRFFAVVSVLLGHWLQWQWTSPWLVKFPFAHGVTLFFVLSGYLITGILIRSKEKIAGSSQKLWKIIKQFYIRRFLRIFPIYYILILILFFLNFENINELLPFLLTYTSNLYISHINDVIGHFTHLWSLAVEEQFYLVWPFIVLLIGKLNFRRALILLLLLSLFYKVFAFYYLNSWISAGYSTLGCMHSLVFGALLAELKINKPRLINVVSKPLVVNSAMLIYLFLVYFDKVNECVIYKIVFDSFCFSIVACLIILRASEGSFKGPIKFILENIFVQFTGKISYGMYLYHGFMSPLFIYLNRYYFKLYIPGPNYTFFYLFSLTFIISVISWYLIEAPLNKLKYKFPYVN